VTFRAFAIRTDSTPGSTAPEHFEGVVAPAMDIVHGLQFHVLN
jgi:hypothetical protein